MAGRTPRHGRRNLTLLREDLDQLALGALPQGTARVDRAAGVIRGVKVLGRFSPNTHDVEGADGTEYTVAALARAAPLYENLKVNVDHPPRKEPGKDRSSYDRLGKLVNVRATQEGLFADLKLLKSH